ncbi:MAG: class I SAM-dependent methyltransferase [Actinomycetota bacterium]
MSTDPTLTKILSRLDAIDARLGSQAERMQTISDRTQRTMYAQIEALIGLYRELDGQRTLPPLRRWAISPDSARLVLGLVREHRPRNVLECGSGASTILFGHLHLAGEIERLIALEHDVVWHELARQQLRQFGLEDETELHFTPLVDHPDEAVETPWYDTTEVEFAPLDMVLVDGPPDATGPLARFPAAPLLLEHCRPGCLFVMDDFIRQSEQDTVDRWIEEYPMTLIAVHESPEKHLAVVQYDGGFGADDA